MGVEKCRVSARWRRWRRRQSRRQQRRLRRGGRGRIHPDLSVWLPGGGGTQGTQARGCVRVTLTPALKNMLKSSIHFRINKKTSFFFFFFFSARYLLAGTDFLWKKIPKFQRFSGILCLDYWYTAWSETRKQRRRRRRRREDDKACCYLVIITNVERSRNVINAARKTPSGT